VVLHQLVDQRAFLAGGLQLQQQAVAQVDRAESRVGRAAHHVEHLSHLFRVDAPGVRLAVRLERAGFGLHGTGQLRGGEGLALTLELEGHYLGAASGGDVVERLGQVAAVVEAVDQELRDPSASIVQIDQRQLLDQRGRKGPRALGRVGQGLELAVALVPGRRLGAAPDLLEVAFVALVLVADAVELALVGIERLLARPVRGTIAVSVGLLQPVALAVAGAVLELQQRVLQQLLLDALGEVERGELQDLHRLDHLRRLHQSLLHPGLLGESELHGAAAPAPRGGQGPRS
jgi:hypothetical protein